MQTGWKNEMRSRKEIENEELPREFQANTELILEVLLDIRELLEDIKEGIRE